MLRFYPVPHGKFGGECLEGKDINIGKFLNIGVLMETKRGETDE